MGRCSQPQPKLLWLLSPGLHGLGLSSTSSWLLLGTEQLNISGDGTSAQFVLFTQSPYARVFESFKTTTEVPHISSSSFRCLTTSREIGEDVFCSAGAVFPVVPLYWIIMVPLVYSRLETAAADGSLSSAGSLRLLSLLSVVAIERCCCALGTH